MTHSPSGMAETPLDDDPVSPQTVGNRQLVLPAGWIRVALAMPHTAISLHKRSVQFVSREHLAQVLDERRRCYIRRRVGWIGLTAQEERRRRVING